MNAIEGGLDFIKKTSPLIIIEFSKYIFDKQDNIKYLKNFLINYDYSIYGTGKIFHSKIQNENERWDEYDFFSSRPFPENMPFNGIDFPNSLWDFSCLN